MAKLSGSPELQKPLSFEGMWCAKNFDTPRNSSKNCFRKEVGNGLYIRELFTFIVLQVAYVPRSVKPFSPGSAGSHTLAGSLNRLLTSHDPTLGAWTKAWTRSYASSASLCEHTRVRESEFVSHFECGWIAEVCCHVTRLVYGHSGLWRGRRIDLHACGYTTRSASSSKEMQVRRHPEFTLRLCTKPCAFDVSPRGWRVCACS